MVLAHGYHMPVILRSWWVALAIGWFLCGWLVSRLHRPYWFAAVMLCLACGFASRAGQYLWWAVGASSDIVTVAGIVAAQASYVAGWFLLGGMLGTVPKTYAPRHRT